MSSLSTDFSLRFLRSLRALPAVWSGLFAGSVLLGQEPLPTAPPAAQQPSLATTLGLNQKTNEPADITFKFRDESIDQVLDRLELLTGRSVIHPQQLPPNTYTFTSQKPMTRSEAIQALQTMLNMNGIAIVPLGDKFLKVTAWQLARTEAPPMIDGSTLDLPPSGQVATKLFLLSFLRATEFAQLIVGIVNQNNAFAPLFFDRANALLVTDSISNLQRIETLLQKVDQPAAAVMAPKFYTLHFAKASDVVNKMRAIFSSNQALTAQIGAGTSYTADDRTNQIVLIADPRLHPTFDELIAKFDVKSDPNTRTEVIYLKHATATQVQQLLNNIVTGQNNAARTASQDGSTLRPGQIGFQGNPMQPGQPQSPTPLPGGQPGAAPNAPATPLANVSTANLISSLGLTAEPSNQFSPLITVAYDERSNSIVVSGTVDDIRLIKDIVGKIDVLLAQVRIEVIIAEVTLNDTDKSGISALNLTIGQTTKNATQITNFDSSFAGWAVTEGVVNPLAFKAALGDTGSKSNVKILSTPSIVTTHNKQAQFKVGESRPIITGSQSTPISGGTTTGFSTSSQVTYKDIAIDLKVTPLIGDDGSVQLTIDQRVDDVVGNVTIDNNQQPIIGTRQATSFVNVQDGQMIVLGGLQRTKNSNDRAKIGFLREIPIISHLFGARTNTAERTELLLFIRPLVLKPENATKDTASKIEELSNKDQVKQFLEDPTKPPKKSLLDKLK